MTDLFNAPVKSRKVRNGIIAHQYDTGVITIDNVKYYGYSMTAAISKFRKKHPKNK